DLIETFFLSMFYEGRISTFHPVTELSRQDLTVIRPLIYARERDVYSFTKDFPILHNPCPANKHTQREYIKNLLKDVRKEIPFASENVLKALTNEDRTNLFKKP
ncbi:MAG: tRNA 2-thiocytidine(32) synthetase TtcA, partial [Clostridia bacterium]|nr:tRNA 2-thiocytidine(32) synthetase TtcA [Clostridia bacterium]